MSSTVPTDSVRDPGKWAYDVGGAGWGNNEQETYTVRGRRRTSLLHAGNLVIAAR